MRNYIRLGNASTLMDYIMRGGYERVGGTIPYRDPRQAKKLMKMFCGPSHAAHMTLSLPDTKMATIATWGRIIRTALVQAGVDPVAVPWTAVRHGNTKIDHVHAVISGRDFLGGTVDPRCSAEEADKAHTALARLIGLELPTYVDLSIPRLEPPVPRRNLKQSINRQFAKSLQEAFREDQPQTLDELNRSLAHRDGAFSTDDGVFFQGRDGTVSAALLGRAFSPIQIFKRLDFCRLLRVARPALDVVFLTHALKPYERNLEEILNARRLLRTDHLARALPDHGELEERVDSGDHALASASGHHEAARRSGNEPGREAAVGRRRGQRVDVDAPDGNPGQREGTLQPAAGLVDRSEQYSPGDADTCRAPEPPLGPERRTGADDLPYAGSGGRDPADGAGNAGDPERAGRLTYGRLLGRVLSVLHKGFRGWRLVLTNPSGIGVRFADQSRVAVTSSKIGCRLRESDSGRFVAAYTNWWPDVELKAFPPPVFAQPNATSGAEDSNDGGVDIPAHEIRPASPEGSVEELTVDFAPTPVNAVLVSEATAAPCPEDMPDHATGTGFGLEANNATPASEGAPSEVVAPSKSSAQATHGRNSQDGPVPDAEDALPHPEDEVPSGPVSGSEPFNVPDIDPDNIEDHEAGPTSAGFDFGEP